MTKKRNFNFMGMLIGGVIGLGIIQLAFLEIISFQSLIIVILGILFGYKFIKLKK